MGKKRNNAAKKKQAAKKKRQSSAYGVSVLKGGTLTQNNGVIDKISLVAAANGNKSQPQHHGKKNSGEARSNNNNGNVNPINIVNNNIQPGKRPRGSPSGENDEFHRLHASLEERSLALQARKEEQRRSKKGGRQKQQKKGWGKFAQPSSAVTNFAPATLTLAPKSTQQLVDDAANQVALGFNEIGQSQSSSTMVNPLLDGTQSSAMGIVPTPGQSSLAAAASLNWKLRVSNVTTTQQQKQQESEQSKNNPFAALDVDSDSDNEWLDKKKGKIVQQFQFKPASFSFQSSTVSNPSQQQLSANDDDDDIDPDL